MAGSFGTVMPFVKPQFFDSNGDPAASYQLFTYDAGTSTKRGTWQDKALTSANTNPIVLDSAGRATIFLSARMYKFVLATPTDTDPPASPVWTVDQVASIPFYNVSTTLNNTGVLPDWEINASPIDSTLELQIPRSNAYISNFYWNQGTMTSNIDVPAGTLTTNGDAIIMEWETDYASATLSARGTIFGTNVDLGTGGATTLTRARYVIHRVVNTDVSVSQTVIQSGAVACAHQTIGTLDLDNTGYTLSMGMASGTWTIRGARAYWVRSGADVL